ncbi:MAG: hypothetical protein K2W96_20565 [Gemmataceae bacterium]|nr:hypothetical protein [Gemmataceae bacterium]
MWCYPAPDIPTLIAALDHDDFDTRQLAEDRLAIHSKLAEAHLRLALPTASPEARRRIRRILHSS